MCLPSFLASVSHWKARVVWTVWEAFDVLAILDLPHGSCTAIPETAQCSVNPARPNVIVESPELAVPQACIQVVTGTQTGYTGVLPESLIYPNWVASEGHSRYCTWYPVSFPVSWWRLHWPLAVYFCLSKADFTASTRVAQIDASVTN